MRNALFSFCLFLMIVPLAAADAGILLPRDKQQPDPTVLSLEEMEIDVRIDNGDARVFVRQIFSNHTGMIEEGNYIFALPSHATISDFATWDGPTRLPAVILERKRAEEIYNELRQQRVDPGLLEMGYHESLPVENLKSYFAIPLRPDAYQAQSARHLRINFQLRSAHPISHFQAPAKTFPLELTENSAHEVDGHYEGEDVNLGEDFVATYDLDPSATDTLEILAYRNPVSAQPSPTEMSPVRSTNEPGFFEAEALLGLHAKANAGTSTSGDAPKTVIILFDTSLSMQWEKLER